MIWPTRFFLLLGEVMSFLMIKAFATAESTKGCYTMNRESMAQISIKLFNYLPEDTDCAKADGMCMNHL